MSCLVCMCSTTGKDLYLDNIKGNSKAYMPYIHVIISMLGVQTPSPLPQISSACTTGGSLNSTFKEPVVSWPFSSQTPLLRAELLYF